MSAGQARQGCLALASHTGWGLADLLDLDLEDLTAWLDTWNEMAPPG